MHMLKSEAPPIDLTKNMLRRIMIVNFSLQKGGKYDLGIYMAGVVALSIIIEFVTADLVSVWFIAGWLAAMVIALFKVVSCGSSSCLSSCR